MIEEWKGFYPILDMNIRLFGAHDIDFDIGKIMKNHDFTPSAGSDFPSDKLVKK